MDWGLTVEQRVLLHLLANPLKQSKWDAPMSLTQAGISRAVGIQRKHLPRTLRRLQECEEVDDRMRHVPNTRQRCHVYILTPLGRQRGEAILEEVGKRSVTDADVPTTIAALVRYDRPVLDVLRGTIHGRFDEALAAPPESSAPDSRTDGESVDSTGLLRLVIETALLDGVITVDERALIDTLSRALAVKGDLVSAIEREVARSIRPAGSTARIFQCMLGAALSDGHIDDSEQAMLDSLASSLDLSARQMEALRDEWMESRLPLQERAYLGALCAVETRSDDIDDEVIGALRSALSIDAEAEQRLLDLAHVIDHK